MKTLERLFIKIAILVLITSCFTIPSTNSYLSDNEISTSNTFQATCWGSPDVPNRTSPLDEYTNTTDITFTWTSTTNHCPSPQTYYNFQLADDSGFTTNLQQSGWITATTYSLAGIAPGEHYWRIQAKDQYNYTSVSPNYHLVVDTTSPLSVSLSISGSWTKAIAQTITNSNFETGNTQGWVKTGHVNVLSSDTISNPDQTITAPHGNYMVRIGDPSDLGNYLWENRLMGSFTSGAKSLYLLYNFFSRDYSPYDNPGFLIRINGQEIFKVNTLAVNPTSETDEAARSTSWQEFYYDLSTYNDPKINLSLSSGNTGDKTTQSWTYVDRIITYFAAAPLHALYNLSGSDNPGGSGINHFEYRVDSDIWSTGSSFQIYYPGEHYVWYRSIDNAGNSSPIYIVRVITDNIPPDPISSLSVSATTVNSANLTWLAPGNDGGLGRASQYDIRYSSTLTDCSGFNFDSATKIDKVPSPQEVGEPETLEVLGLNPAAKYCFAIKTADEAPNWSDISNILLVETPPSITDINPGDVVINELMWMGSSVSDADEWLELRNITNHPIDLSHFKLTKLSGVETDMAISFAGKSIPAHGYFLIANSDSYVAGDSQLNVAPDIWDSSLDLSDTTLQIKLYWNDGATDYLIDTAWDGTAPGEGLYNVGSGFDKYYSMERVSVPGDGTNPLSWYTCIDTASTSEFFDGGADERGTPRAANRSENEPLAHQSLIDRTPSPTEVNLSVTPTPLPTTTPEPELNLNISNDYKKLSFNVKYLINYIKLSYELTYDSEIGHQGIIGTADLNNQEEFVKDNLILGTCSTGGTCVFHSGINNINLKVDLEDKDNKIYSLFQSIK
jgi:hypothetical protein